ncbi:MAG: type I-C CRISPR-associated protein Cas8c/Csd1 [Oscillospiraceae bacterium]|jgi:CRISPR-associated protein Csd1|nr:type I-C CRISPR-associated protein Cas8c/Csd1 [Oscillospiraceae bacterium]
MILQALCGYYDRLAENGNAAMPGWAVTPVAWCVTLDLDGKLAGDVISLVDAKKPQQMLTPQQPKRSSGVDAAFLCDNTGYFFAADEKRGQQKREASRELHREVLGGVDDDGAAAVLKFFDADVQELSDKLDAGNIVFRLEGSEGYIHNRHAVKSAWVRHYEKLVTTFEKGQCLVTGDIDIPISRIHGNIGGFGQDKPTVVGFNQDSFKSYNLTRVIKKGKKEEDYNGTNAPVSVIAEHKYTTALNALIADSKHVVRMADTKVLFWAESEARNEEETFSALFGGHWDDGKSDERILDEPAAKKIQSLLSSFESGKIPDTTGFDKDVTFHILGISAAKTRLVIRFFHSDTFGNLLERIGQHYKDIAIIKSERDRDWLTKPIDILRETAVQQKYDNIPPTLEGALIRSILDESAYPYSLYNAMLTRVRADKNVNRTRAGVVKGFLNRTARKNKQEETMTVALNLEERNRGYLLGRLIAVFEKAQQEALGNVNSSVLDKYLNTALAAPQMVFTSMLLLHKKHLAKSDFNKGRAVYFNQLVGSIMEEFDSTGFPQTLNAEDQGRFIVGYYHQNHDLWKKKETSNTTTEETNNV